MDKQARQYGQWNDEPYWTAYPRKMLLFIVIHVIIIIFGAVMEVLK